MTPYVVSEGLITEADADARDLAEGFMADLPDPELGAPCCATRQRGGKDERTYWSCHGLVRAFAKLHPGWIVLDGFFGVLKHRHSWLARFSEHGGVVILDLYPVGALMPMIVDAGPSSPWRPLYVESSMSYRPNEREVWEKEAEYALALLAQARAEEKNGPPETGSAVEEYVLTTLSKSGPTVVEFPQPSPPPQAFEHVDEFAFPEDDPPPAPVIARPVVADRPVPRQMPPPMRETFVPVPERQAPLVGVAQAPTVAPAHPVFSEPVRPRPQHPPQQPEKGRFKLGETMRNILDRTGLVREG